MSKARAAVSDFVLTAEESKSTRLESVMSTATETDEATSMEESKSVMFTITMLPKPSMRTTTLRESVPTVTSILLSSSTNLRSARW